MAFQPLVDLEHGEIYGYEALVRGSDGGSAFSVLSRVDDDNLYRFDQACRVKALELAHRLGNQGLLSINFLPNAVYEPEACIQATLVTAERLGWPVDRLCFEIIETEHVRDRRHLQNIVDTYRDMGMTVALDDFGSGHANLDLLVDITPDLLKIDRRLVDGVDRAPRQQILIDQIVNLAEKLDIALVAEGVETLEEARWLYGRGITRQQGYWYARPETERLPQCQPAQLALVRGQH
ncbi:EAL domain-containing protein [Salinicola endophyticus]